MTDEIKEVTQVDLMHACEKIITEIMEISGGDNTLVLTMLINVTINTLEYGKFCKGCYANAITQAIMAIPKQDNVEHFDFTEATLTQVTNPTCH